MRQLDALGMVWNAHGHAFDEGLAVARAWAEEHGHLLAPVSAVSEGGFPIGVWLKNQRRGRRRQAVEAAAAHEQGQRVPRAGGGCRRAVWTRWTRSIPGGARPGTPPGSAATASPRTTSTPAASSPSAGPGFWSSRARTWGRGCRRSGWGGTSSGPRSSGCSNRSSASSEASEDERPVRRTQDDKWMLNLAAARRFHAREGHLQVPRKHTELVPLTEAGRGAPEPNAAQTACPSHSACGSPTPAAAPTNSRHSAGTTSTSLACAGDGCSSFRLSPRLRRHEPQPASATADWLLSLRPEPVLLNVKADQPHGRRVTAAAWADASRPCSSAWGVDQRTDGFAGQRPG